MSEPSAEVLAELEQLHTEASWAEVNAERLDDAYGDEYPAPARRARERARELHRQIADLMEAHGLVDEDPER